jgi:hypothetical protein
VDVLVEELLDVDPLEDEDPFDDEDPLEEPLVDAALLSDEVLLEELLSLLVEPLSDLAAAEVACEPFLDSERESVR